MQDSRFNPLVGRLSKRDSALNAKERTRAQVLEKSEGPPIPKSAVDADEP